MVSSNSQGKDPLIAEKHEWCAAKPGDSRSPCPALNTLANHGYLPRDGKEISASKLIKALKEGLNCSTPLAHVLAYGGCIALGRFSGMTLTEIGQHNRVEHNASIVHEDANGQLYAPTNVNPEMMKLFLKDSSSGQYMTVEDIAATRVRREATYEKGISAFQGRVARGEVALVLGIFGHDGTNEHKIPIEHIRSFFQEEKFPEGWKPPHKQRLRETMQISSKLHKAMSVIKREGRKRQEPTSSDP